VKTAFFRLAILAFFSAGSSFVVLAQCNACSADPDCVSADGFPTLCPSALPNATAGEDYETTITFFLPAEITDPGSGLVATLNSVTVTNISGVPPGMQIELDDPDGVYTPAGGQNSGCATLCGAPTFPGAFGIQINILAVVTALGFEQEVSEGFSLPLWVEPGAGGTSSFTFTPSAGCGSVVADFQATVFGVGNQITDHQWSFGAFVNAQGAEVQGQVFDEEGEHTIVLQTTLLDQVLDQVQLFSTAGGGWDDFFGNPDPYFTLKDGNEVVVYTSATVDDVGAATWSGLGIVLNNPPYSIDFYDEDLFDGDDWLGWAPFTPNGPGTIGIDANPSNAQLTIGLNPVVVVSDSALITVHPFPSVGILASGDAALSCTHDSLFQYDWWMGDSLVASGSDPVYTPLESGWYSVVGLDSNGCSAQSDSLLFCMPNAAIPLELIELNGSPMALETQAGLNWWLWSFNGIPFDTLSSEGSVWFPMASGWYSVESQTALGCPVASDSVLVCWPLTAPSIMQDAEGNLVLDDPDWSAIEWWQDGEPLAGEEGDILMAPGEGVYTVWVSDFQDCPAVQSEAITYVDVWEEHVNAFWRFGPNPFAGGLTLSVAPEWKGGQAVLRDAAGRIVVQRLIREEHWTWSLPDLPRGIYLMQLIDEQGHPSQARRVVKK